tara:strand:- start:4810 stop:5973 length:1164 start_codon:yes stop_codon:yes gene_type:complete
MSYLSNLISSPSSLVQLGDKVTMLTPLSAPTTAENGDYVLQNTVLSQSSYPDLYNLMGSIGSSFFTPAASPPAFGTPQYHGMSYGNGIFLCGGAGGSLATSTNGSTWTTRTSGTASTIAATIYGNGLYLYGGAGGVLKTSTDAITWDTRTSGTTTAITALAYANGIYIYAAYNALATSTDAITWTNSTTALNGCYAVTYGNGVYAYAGASGTIATSTDTITWTSRTSQTTSNLWTLIYANGGFVYGGNLGNLGTSTDGITWTARTSNLTATIYNIVYGTSGFLAGGYGGLATSTDAITWTRLYYPSSATLVLYGTAYGNGIYAYGDNSAIYGTATNFSTPAYSPYYNIATEFLVPPQTLPAGMLTQPTSTVYGTTAALNIYVKATNR